MKDTDSKDEMTTLDDHQLQELYAWVDEISLTRPKRNITRDFSDGGKCIDSTFRVVKSTDTT